MNNIALGQYVDRNSIIHHLDPRTKIISLIFLMVAVFLVPSPTVLSNPIYSFIGLGIFLLILLVVILCTKISIVKYLKSIRQIFFLIILAFVIQIFSPSDSKVYNIDLSFSYINISIDVILLVLFIIFRKKLPLKMMLFLAILIGGTYILTIDFGHTFSVKTIKIYEFGLYNGAFYCLRIFIVLLLSTVLTLTTKPTDLTNGLEWLLHPLTWIKINVSIFAMMISLALRFIPTLFNEINRILKAQSSRGVDFKEGNLKEQVVQILSLLVPMFSISYKRAADLADAMEARAYIPGAKRTKLNVLRFKLLDYLGLIIVLGLFAVTICWKVMKVFYL